MKTFIHEHIATIVFVVVVVLIVGGLTFMSIWKDGADERMEKRMKAENEAAAHKYDYVAEQDIYPIATITMEDGKEMVLKLYPNKAPITVENFIYLANSGFYDGLTFHRTMPDFVIQGGDKEGTGSGESEYTIKGEFAANNYEYNDLEHNVGVISMARKTTPYNSAGTQFFIVVDETYKSSLDGYYAAFGEIIEGLDVAKEISNVEVITRDKNSLDANRPVNPPVIKTIRVDTKGVEYPEPAKI